MKITSQFHDAWEETSAAIDKAHGLANSVFFVLQQNDMIRSNDDLSRAMTCLVLLLEDTLKDASAKHQAEWTAAGGV